MYQTTGNLGHTAKFDAVKGAVDATFKVPGREVGAFWVRLALRVRSGVGDLVAADGTLTSGTQGRAGRSNA